MALQAKRDFVNLNCVLSGLLTLSPHTRSSQHLHFLLTIYSLLQWKCQNYKLLFTDKRAKNLFSKDTFSNTEENEMMLLK